VIETANDFPVVRASSIPTVTAAQMAEVDRLANEEFGIDILQMMEQAGSHLTELVRAELGGDLPGRRVIVAVGPGNNGGGGLAAARHLANRGASVRVILARPVNRLTEASRHQLATLLEMSIDCCVAIYDIPEDELDRESASADAIVDAVPGNAGAPTTASCGWWSGSRASVGHGSIPSGIDVDTGRRPRCRRATAADVPAKPGLFRRRPRARRTGHLADIGLPAALYRRLGVEVGTPFATGRIVRLEVDG
jgi:NAD(P)H-hydrate epimerase